MRFEKLLLRAFGPFTDRVLDFEAHAPAGLHLVYGPNEAGKSSALRATTDLLFGIPLRSDDDFVHKHADMRVGAVVRADDGRRVALMRRKANKAPLRALDEATGQETDAVLEADIQAVLTGGLDRALFESMFGIDHARLREGGRQLLAGEGELGASLFQAGSGLSGVRAVLDRLDSDAQALFVPRGQVRSINETLRRLDELKREQRDRTVRPREWASLEAAVDTARKRDAEAAEQMRAVRDEQRRLERMRTFLPQAARHAQLVAELAQLADAPQLPADAAERRLRAQAALGGAQDAAARAQREADELAARRAGIEIDTGVLAQAESIARLHHDADRAAEAERELAAGSSEAAQLARRLRSLLARVGQDVAIRDDDASIDALSRESSVSAGTAEAVRAAAARLASARQAADTALQRAAAAEGALAAAQQALDALPAPVDDSALAAAHAAALALGDIDADLAAADARIAQFDARIADGARGLGACDAQALRGAVPPPLGHAEALAARMANLRAERESLDATLAVMAAETDALQAERARLAASGEVVTASTLAAARARRDQAWARVRARLDGGADAARLDAGHPTVRGAPELRTRTARVAKAVRSTGATAELFEASALFEAPARPELAVPGPASSGPGLARSDAAAAPGNAAASVAADVAALDTALREADRQADLLRADADRAARFASIERDLAERAERAATGRARRDALLADEQGAIIEWSARLASAGLPFMEPDALVRWHRQRDAWLSQCALRDEAAGTRDARRSLRSASWAALARALDVGGSGRAGAGVETLAGDADAAGPFDMQAPMAVLLQAAEARLASGRRAAESRAEATRALRQAQAHLARERATADEARSRASAAEQAWDVAIASLRLPAGAPAAQAEARLRELDEIERLHAQWHAARDSLAGRSAFLAARAAQIEALALQLGRPLPGGNSGGTSGSLLVAALHGQAQAAHDAHAQACALDERIDRARQAVAQHAVAADEAARALAAMRAAAGVEHDAQLPAVEQRAARRQALSDELHALEQQMLEAADRPLDALLREAQGHDLDAVARRLEELAAEGATLEPQARQAQAELVEARHRLAQVDGSEAAAATREAAESALARLRGEALAYARARLAHALLEHALAGYQARAQGPMIERASRLLDAMTAGRYPRVRAEEDGERRVLAVERADGKALRVEHLSEGTRDVLYLALRLAALDLHLDGNPPMPLVLDDILLTFDDARSAATLAALAALSRRTQVLLFTHHEHLVDVARRAVTGGALAVHRLDADAQPVSRSIQ